MEINTTHDNYVISTHLQCWQSFKLTLCLKWTLTLYLYHLCTSDTISRVRYGQLGWYLMNTTINWVCQDVWE